MNRGKPTNPRGEERDRKLRENTLSHHKTIGTGLSLDRHQGHASLPS